MIHSLSDPHVLSGCFLDDYAAAWARRLMIPTADLGRRDCEPDVDYRSRLLDLLAGKVEGSVKSCMTSGMARAAVRVAA